MNRLPRGIPGEANARKVKKWIDSYAAAPGGLDTLVFACGIGENAPLVCVRN